MDDDDDTKYVKKNEKQTTEKAECANEVKRERHTNAPATEIIFSVRRERARAFTWIFGCDKRHTHTHTHMHGKRGTPECSWDVCSVRAFIHTLKLNASYEYVRGGGDGRGVHCGYSKFEHCQHLGIPDILCDIKLNGKLYIKYLVNQFDLSFCDGCARARSLRPYSFSKWLSEVRDTNIFGQFHSGFSMVVASSRYDVFRLQAKRPVDCRMQNWKEKENKQTERQN